MFVLRLAMRSLSQLVLQEKPDFVGFVLDICLEADMTQRPHYDLQDRTKHELTFKTCFVSFLALLLHVGTTRHAVTSQQVSRPI